MQDKVKTGRPTTEINDTQLRAFLRLKPSLEDTAAFFECNIKTIERYIKKKYNLSFVQFREQNTVHSRHRLVQKALMEATKEKVNTAMLIFCLKNMCGWKDQVQISGDETAPIKFAYDPTRKLNANV